MSDVTAITSRRCIGPCGRELPLTRKYYYFRERVGQFEGRCRECQIKKNLAKRHIGRTLDGLQGGVLATHRRVKAVHAEMDPGGIIERELYRRLELILRYCGQLPMATKIAALERWKARFLQAEQEAH